MTSRKIIIGIVFSTIIERLKLIRLFCDRHIVHGRSLDIPSLYRDRRQTIARREEKYREVIRRSSSTLGERAHCTRRQCPRFTFALVRVHRTARCVRSKKLPQHAIKTRIDTTCPAATFAYRERRHADCKSSSLARSIATGSRQDPTIRQKRTQRDAVKLDESSSTSDYAFLAMSNGRSDLRAADSRARLRRERCHVSRLGQILIKAASIASRAREFARLDR